MTLCELHKRRTWFDERTANAICTASFHPSSRFVFSFVRFGVLLSFYLFLNIKPKYYIYVSFRIMISTLCFLLDYEKIENYQDSDDESSDEEATESPQVILRRETVYKVRGLSDKH